MIYLVAVAVALLVLFIQKLNVYFTWKRKRVPYIFPLPLFGNFKDTVFGKRASWQVLYDSYFKFNEKRYFGMFQFFQPVFVLKDPDLIKQIGIKDFDYFSEHGEFVDDDFDTTWSNNLFAMKAKKWKHMRPTLSPAFTSAKMKFMFNLMQKTSHQFTEYFNNQANDEIKVELKDIFTKYTNDVIATTAFGLECNTLHEQNNMFYLMGKKLSSFSGSGIIRLLIHRFSPLLQRLLNIKMVADDVKVFFAKVINDTLKHRRENGLKRKDMIHLLLEAQKGVEQTKESNIDKSFAATEEFSINTKHEKLPITDDDIISQAMVFFVAGFDTASTLMTLTGYELAINPDIQKRLQKEIDDTYEECNGNVTYENILEMKYLDMVITETLRKWPPVPVYDRKCIKNYTIPSKNDDEKDVVIEKDSLVWIPAYPLQRDPKFYPNPDKFDPERFNEENKQKIVSNGEILVPFGVGPRNCIGSRFALLENKVMWFYLLRQFDLIPTTNSLKQPKWDPHNFSFCPIGGFKVTLKKRQETK